MLATGKKDHIKNNHLAPLIIFTYNRLDTLELSIKSLQENFLANETDVFIFSDYAGKEKDIEFVNSVRKFLHSIDGFKSITIIERNENYGLAKNVIEGVTDIINKYEKVIVLEDDLLTSKNFLSYMNQALDFYENDERIFSISGFSWNLNSLKYLKEDVFLSYRPSSWGWATWKEKWTDIDWELKDFDSFIKNKKATRAFNRGGMDMTRMLKHYKEGKNNSWAIRYSYNMFKKNKYCIYPKLSKIQNIGFSSNSTHCRGEHIHKTILDNSEDIDFNFSKSLILNTQVLKEFKFQNNYFYKTIKRITIKIKNFLRRK